MKKLIRKILLVTTAFIMMFSSVIYMPDSNVYAATSNLKNHESLNHNTVKTLDAKGDRSIPLKHLKTERSNLAINPANGKKWITYKKGVVKCYTKTVGKETITYFTIPRKYSKKYAKAAKDGGLVSIRYQNCGEFLASQTDVKVTITAVRTGAKNSLKYANADSDYPIMFAAIRSGNVQFGECSLIKKNGKRVYACDATQNIDYEFTVYRHPTKAEIAEGVKQYSKDLEIKSYNAVGLFDVDIVRKKFTNNGNKQDGLYHEMFKIRSANFNNYITWYAFDHFRHYTNRNRQDNTPIVKSNYIKAKKYLKKVWQARIQSTSSFMTIMEMKVRPMPE